MNFNEQERVKRRECDCCGAKYTIDDVVEGVDGLGYEQCCMEYCFACFISDRWKEDLGPFDRYMLEQIRKCTSCEADFTIGATWPDQKMYFVSPYDYFNGCHEYCLNCWLGCGPPETADNENAVDIGDEASLSDHFPASDPSVRWSSESNDCWPYNQVYNSLTKGELLPTYQWYFDIGLSLCVMPIDRLILNRVTTFPTGIVFYPKGHLDLDQLCIAPNSLNSTIPSEIQAKASGVDQKVFDQYPLVVFPVNINWDQFRRGSHKLHMQLIRFFAESIDREALDFCRYKQCRLDDVEDLPCRAGQIPSTSPMMAGLAIYNPKISEGRIIGGAAFTHCITKGLGMPLIQPEWDRMPGKGEMGELVRRGLALYSQLLEANSETSRYVQSMSLFEFLAYPDRYADFEKVRKVIAKYLSEDKTLQSHQLAKRFQQLGSGERHIDPVLKKPNGKPVIHKGRGLRQQMVHEGKRLEQILPSDIKRTALFQELDSYLRPVIKHMIEYSHMDFEDYEEIREQAYLNLNPRNESASSDFDQEEVPF